MSHPSNDLGSAYWHGWASESLECAVSELARRRRAFFDDALRHHGFGSAQLPVLAYLWDGHDGSVQRNIADALTIDQGSITRAVHVLEDLGLVQRRTDDRDARTRRVCLTATGSALAPEVAKVARAWDVMLTEGWTPRQRAAMVSDLHQMLARAQVRKGH